ncbi:MAG: hypothetical protein J6A61_05865 [Clostridia bacterium]|nr:hypothetical protein [Clostridia bacterium]
MNISLTKEADYLICELYHVYLNNRKTKIPKVQARNFGNLSRIIEKLSLKNWLPEDIEETCLELHRAGLLICETGDNTITNAQLTDDGVIYMEHRFSNNLASILEHINQVKSLISFI